MFTASLITKSNSDVIFWIALIYFPKAFKFKASKVHTTNKNPSHTINFTYVRLKAKMINIPPYWIVPSIGVASPRLHRLHHDVKVKYFE